MAVMAVSSALHPARAPRAAQGWAVAADALGGEYNKLSAEARKAAAEIKAALRRRQPVDSTELRGRLQPLAVGVMKQADAEMPKLARLHNEALMIQHGLREHVKALDAQVKLRINKT